MGRPAARAATGFAPTASKRLPTTVRLLTKLVRAIRPIATRTDVGTPDTELAANADRASVVLRGTPPVMARLPPYSSAFMPIVVTIGVIPMRLTRIPFASPASTATPYAIATAAPNLLGLPFG